MKKSRAVEALRLIRRRPGLQAGMLDSIMDIEHKDMDGFWNPVSIISTKYRLGYLVGWLHGAGLRGYISYLRARDFKFGREPDPIYVGT